MIDTVEMVVVVGDDSGVQVAGIDGNWFHLFNGGGALRASDKTLDLLFWIWLILTLNIVIVSDKGFKNRLF